VMADIITSLVRPLPQLSVVFYALVVTVIIYAQFGLEYLEDYFMFDNFEDDSPGCHSVVSCAFLIFYGGVTAGNIAEVMDNPHKNNGNYIWRMVYDISFFIWVGVMLFNVLTGLIVDTFGALRDEANERDDILDNQCFICGFTRSGYDDVGITSIPSFDLHKTEEHAIWNYVYFYRYLQQKDPSDYNGVESYVSQQLEKGSLGWLPSRTSLCIQNSGEEVPTEEDPLEQVIMKTIQQEMMPISKSLKSVESRIETMEGIFKK
jgi:hypothetical protein